MFTKLFRKQNFENIVYRWAWPEHGAEENDIQSSGPDYRKANTLNTLNRLKSASESVDIPRGAKQLKDFASFVQRNPDGSRREFEDSYSKIMKAVYRADMPLVNQLVLREVQVALNVNWRRYDTLWLQSLEQQLISKPRTQPNESNPDHQKWYKYMWGKV